MGFLFFNNQKNNVGLLYLGESGNQFRSVVSSDAYLKKSQLRVLHYFLLQQVLIGILTDMAYLFVEDCIRLKCGSTSSLDQP